MKKFSKAKAEAVRKVLLYILKHGNKNVRARLNRLLKRAIARVRAKEL